MAKRSKLNLNFNDLLEAVSIIFCQDALQGRDGIVSYFKLLDEVKTPTLPIRVPLVIALEFARRGQDDDLLFAEEPLVRIMVTNPLGVESLFAELSPLPDRSKLGWRVNRTILHAPILFQNEGVYTFDVYGKTKSSEYVKYLTRSLLIQVVEKSQFADAGVIVDRVESAREKPSKKSQRKSDARA